MGMRRLARKAPLERATGVGSWPARLRAAGMRASHAVRQPFSPRRHATAEQPEHLGKPDKPDKPDARSRYSLGTLALLAICLGLLATGDAAPRAAAPVARATPPVTPQATLEPTATLWPTPTPTPFLPPPLNVPPGWQVYSDHHFAVAYPPGWQPTEHVVRRDDGTPIEASVSFNSDDGAY